MVNEWTKVELLGPNNDGEMRRFTIADGVSVSKGQLLVLLDNRACSGAIDTSSFYAGVAAEEHCPNQGVTSISVWTNGIFLVTASAALVVGNDITGAGNNCVWASAAGSAGTASGAGILGYSLESATAKDTGVQVRLRL